MARILMGWELGGGLGHVKTLVGVARELAAAGHQPLFAVRNLVEPASLFGEGEFPVLQAPAWRPRRGDRPFLASSYADILAVRGFKRADDLLPMVRAWQSLIDLARPDLVVCDHSPTLCLAAFGTLPTVLLGNGFTLPPADLSEFPTLVPGATAIMPQTRMLEVIREVQRHRSRPAPETLPGLLAGTERFGCTFPELDPYQATRSESLVGPIGPLPAQSPLPSQRAVFAYLTAETAGLNEILQAIATAGFPASIYIRDASPALNREARQRGFEVFDRPAPLGEVLPRVTAVIHLASLGMAEAALLAGRPQVLIPPHLEKQLIANSLQSMGVAPRIEGALTVTSLTRAIHNAVGNPEFARHAVTWARTLAARWPCGSLSRITERCLAILAA